MDTEGKEKSDDLFTLLSCQSLVIVVHHGRRDTHVRQESPPSFRVRESNDLCPLLCLRSLLECTVHCQLKEVFCFCAVRDTKIALDGSPDHGI